MKCSRSIESKSTDRFLEKITQFIFDCAHFQVGGRQPTAWIFVSAIKSSTVSFRIPRIFKEKE